MTCRHDIRFSDGKRSVCGECGETIERPALMLLDMFAALGQRFAGVDLQYRRHGVDWPHPWRASLVATKNERESYRITAHGSTQYEAIAALLAAVAEEDRR